MSKLQILRESASDSGASQLKIFENEQFGEIRVAGTSEKPLFCLPDICRVLGLQVTPTKNRLKQEGVSLIKGVSTTTNQYGVTTEQEVMLTFVNEQNLYRVIMRSDKPQAEAFQDWVCEEVLPSIRKTGAYSIRENKKKEDLLLDDQLKTATWLAEFLNLNDVSKLAIAKFIAEPLGLPVPDYVPSKGIIKSATELLKENGIQMSAIAFNKIALNKGILVELERKSSHGKKKFKNISNDWLAFGENQVNPNNPKETQPLWYADKFRELLKMMDIL